MNRLAFIDPNRCDFAAEMQCVLNVDIERVYGRRAQLDMLRASYKFESFAGDKPFAFTGGLAIIPIHGLLVNRIGWSASFATGYDFIRGQMHAALDDPDVVGIVYDVNSNGGVVSGCSELARDVYNARGVKPSVAVVDSNCYSAAYYIASAADKVVCTPSGGVGSIGCVAMHLDISGMLETDGLKVSLIHEGAEKVDGNPFQPLSDRARESIAADVRYHYDMFVEAISRHRGMSEDDIRATEARCYNPPDALGTGLIDGVSTSIEAVRGLLGGGQEMTTTAAPALSQEDVGRIAAEAATRAVAEDRARVSAIRGAAEAQGRAGLAEHLAYNTAMTVEEARAVLGAAPKQEEQKQHVDMLGAVMDMSPGPNVGADNSGNTDGGTESVPNRILANYAALTGRKVRAA